MAAVPPAAGGQSPTSLSRTLERVFEEAQHTGEINLSGRKLKEYPKVAAKYDLGDSTLTDISKNRFSEIPPDVCQYPSTEKLICHHNVIKNIPQALVQLQSLVKLNLSRNQLSTIPPFICQLQSLEVLLASNNKLVSLPEEIGHLEKLMELDVSSNEITHLPSQIGDLDSLRDLDVRRNLLVELPPEIIRLRLHRLDISGNRISGVPCDIRRMDTLQEIVMDNNPLVFPPASICTRGRIHVMKYLHTEAMKEDRKRGIMNDGDHRRNFTKPLHSSGSDEFRHYLDSPGERRKRHTVDSGYSTTDSTSDVRLRWSPSEVNSNDLEEANTLALKAAESVKEQRHSRDLELQRRLNARNASDTISITSSQSLPVTTHNGYIANNHGSNSSNTSPYGSHGHHPHFGNHIQTSSPLATTAGASPLMHQSPSTPQMQQSMSSSSLQSSSQPHTPSPMSTGSSSGPPCSSSTPGSTTTTPSPRVGNSAIDPFKQVDASSSSQSSSVDEFTRELQRQKAEYEAKKKMAVRLRREMEEGERQKLVTPEVVEEERERDERRRAAVRLQEEQTAILEQQKEEARRKSEQNSMNSSMSSSGSPQYNSYHDNVQNNRRVGQSHSFKEDKRTYGPASSGHFRRTVSETQYAQSAHEGSTGQHPAGRAAADTGSASNWARNNGIDENSLHRNGSEPNHNLPPDEEFRLRHEAMIDHQRREAQRIRKCIEEEKMHLKQIHNDSNQDDKGRTRQIQKDAVYSYYSKRTVYSSGKAMEDEEAGFSFSRDSTPNTSFSSSSTMPNMKSRTTLPAAVQRGLEEMKDDLDNMNPAFTIRRQFQHAQEEMEMMDELRRNIETRLKVKLPDDLPNALKDGVVLCHLANHIRPRSVSSIHVPSPAVPKLSMAKCRRNVENFLEACRRMGVEQEHICPVMCVLEEKGTAQLAVTVDALLNRAGAPKVAMV